MGGGASSQAAFEQMIAATMILGEAMVQGLDPRFVRFPDMYRPFDFHVGPRKPQPRSFQGGQMILFVRAPDKVSTGDDDEEDEIPQLEVLNNDGKAVAKPTEKKKPEDEDDGPAESNDDYLIVYVGGEKVVLDRATLNQPNNDGWTPLHSCCHMINAQDAGITILNELVKQKADLNQVTKRGPGSFSCGWTPLHIAVAYGLEALALKLIRAGAEVNTKNTVGWTPLYETCHRNYATVARELLKVGAKHDVICPEFAMCPYPGQHPLAEASRQGALDTVKVLLEWGVDKNAVNSMGWTALHEAAYHNRIGIVKLLIVYGVDVMLKTNKGSVAKDLTIWSDIRTILEDLMKDQAPTASPKREKSADPEEDDTKRASPKKSPMKLSAPVAPLSRKEEYALLGDLPSLETPPTIAIKDVDSENDSKAHEDEEEEPASPSKTKSKKKRKQKRMDVPDEFKCAVTRKLLKDPLRSPYGQVFERKVIEVWVRDFGNRCPLTGQPLALGQLISDTDLKNAIHAWKYGDPKTGEEASATSSSSSTREAEPATPSNGAKAFLLTTTGSTPEVDPYDF